jgi:hypothetical protein
MSSDRLSHDDNICPPIRTWRSLCTFEMEKNCHSSSSRLSLLLFLGMYLVRLQNEFLFLSSLLPTQQQQEQEQQQ